MSDKPTFIFHHGEESENLIRRGECWFYLPNDAEGAGGEGHTIDFDKGGWVPIGKTAVSLSPFGAPELIPNGCTTTIQTGLSINVERVIPFKVSRSASRLMRLFFGMSRKEWRIREGIERKQLLHNGGKP